MENGGRIGGEVHLSAMEENNAEGGANPMEGGGEGGVMRSPDEYMPIANILRIMRKVLPPHAKVADDAKETVQECLTEFISFITGEANLRCHSECRKTITAEDVLAAMAALGFRDYIRPLTLYLNSYRAQDPLRFAATAIPPPPPNQVQPPLRRFMSARGAAAGEGSSSAGGELRHLGM